MQATIDEIRKILRIIEESDCDELHLEYDDLKITVRKSAGNDPPPAREAANPAAPPPVAEAAPVAAHTEAIPEGLAVVYAPMVGTVYRAPSPDAPTFCEEGQKVAADDTVCLIEVMKLFNSIAAGVPGTVRKILVGDGDLVAYNQPIILIEPD